MSLKLPFITRKFLYVISVAFWKSVTKRFLLNFWRFNGLEAIIIRFPKGSSSAILSNQSQSSLWNKAWLPIRQLSKQITRFSRYLVQSSNGINHTQWHRLFQGKASTIINGIDCYQERHRPLKMASLVYERENCVSDSHFIDRFRTAADQ